MKHGRIPFEYTRITDFIFIGTNACCTTHFKRGLLRKGIRADISLEDKRIDQPWGVSYFLWLPTKNHAPPSQTQLRIGVSVLDTLVRNRVKTYVHCLHGHGRAPTLVAAYLVSHGMPLQKAIALLKRKRPIVHLERAQIAALRRFARQKATFK